MIVDDEGFSGTRTAQVVGISYRQLDYWARTDLIRPSLADATGSGSRRRYSYRDLLELKVVKKLIDAGTDVLLCEGDDLINVVRRGQGVLNVLPLAGVKEELDEGIVALHPRVAAADAPEVATAVPGR